MQSLPSKGHGVAVTVITVKKSISYDAKLFKLFKFFKLFKLFKLFKFLPSYLSGESAIIVGRRSRTDHYCTRDD